MSGVDPELEGRIREDTWNSAGVDGSSFDFSDSVFEIRRVDPDVYVVTDLSTGSCNYLDHQIFCASFGAVLPGRVYRALMDLVASGCEYVVLDMKTKALYKPKENPPVPLHLASMVEVYRRS